MKIKHLNELVKIEVTTLLPPKCLCNDFELQSHLFICFFLLLFLAALQTLFLNNNMFIWTNWSHWTVIMNNINFGFQRFTFFIFKLLCSMVHSAKCCTYGKRELFLVAEQKCFLHKLDLMNYPRDNWGHIFAQGIDEAILHTSSRDWFIFFERFFSSFVILPRNKKEVRFKALIIFFACQMFSRMS